MSATTSNCTTEPIFKSLTQRFLDIFGTGTIPDGYVKGDGYGKRTNAQDFAELFIVFYILIVIAVLMLFVFLMMIIFLVWYYRRRKSDAKKCTKSKCWSILLLLLLFLLLIFLAFALYITFKNSWDLKKQIAGKDKSSKDGLDSDIQKTMEQINQVLVVEFADMKSQYLSKSSEIDETLISFPETEKIYKNLSYNAPRFDEFIKSDIEPGILDYLMYDDASRMFSRNFSSYVGSTENGKNFVVKFKTVHYKEFVQSFADWAMLYHSAHAISALMHYYEKLQLSSRAKGIKTQIDNCTEKNLNERERDATAMSQEIERKLNGLTRRADSSSSPLVLYNFGFIMCIVSIVVIFIYFLILLCSLCKIRSRTRAMIKPLVIMFIILTLTFLLMAFVTIYHFFYGVIEYNGICGGMHRQTAEDGGLYNVVLTYCTNNQKIYQLMTENNLIRPMSAWPNIHTSEMNVICNSSCPQLDLNFIEENLSIATGLPTFDVCMSFNLTAASLAAFLSTTGTNLKKYQLDSFLGFRMVDIKPENSYYWSRVNMSICNFNMESKVHKRIASVRTPTNAELIKCREDYNIAKDFIALVPNSVKGLTENCTQLRDKCSSYITTIKQKYQTYIINSESKLKRNIAACESLLRLATSKLNDFCKCETYILNGVWVGGLLFLLPLLLTLLLLPCLMCLFIKCDDQAVGSRRDRTRGRRGDERGHRRSSRGRRYRSTESIILPAIPLPRTAIDMIRANPDVQVRYLVKNKTK